MRMNPNDVTTRRSISTVTNLLASGKVNTLACHSQGAAICANAARAAASDRLDLSNTNFVFVGGVQSHLPSYNRDEKPVQIGRLRVIENTNDYFNRESSARYLMNKHSGGMDEKMYEDARRRDAYRRGNNGSHPFADYAQIVACQSRWRDECN